MRRIGQVAILGVCLMAMLGCARGPRNIDALSREFAERGVVLQKERPVDVPYIPGAPISEAAILENDQVRMQVFRTKNKQAFTILNNTHSILGMAEVATGERMPRPQIYGYKPFVVIVRQEPERGQVVRTLDEIFD